MASPFDVHDHRHELKQLSDEGGRAYFDNRGDVPCPVCGEPFDELLAMEASTAQLSPDRALDFCLLDTEEKTYLFTHAREE